MAGGHQVFISYPSEHRETADAILNELTAAGFSCWMAPASIPPAAAMAGFQTNVCISKKCAARPGFRTPPGLTP